MIKKLAGIFILLTMVKYGYSQKEVKSENNVHFSSVVNAGLLSGQNGESFSIQTANGINYKSWFAGVGVGVDYYGERSVPLFIDVNKTFLDKAQSPFIYVHGGLNLPWLNERQKSNNNYVDAKPGSYFDAGAGVKIKINSNQKILLSLGYSQKVSKGREEVQRWPIGVFQPVTTTEKYVNTFNRLILKVGFQF
jgi:hypothetical protein